MLRPEVGAFVPIGNHGHKFQGALGVAARFGQVANEGWTTRP